MALAAPASSAFVEVGASANYRSSGYDKSNFVESIAYTASLSYYFWEMCAWELNYTTGYSKQVTKGPLSIDPKETVEDNIQLVSLDLVLSFAGKQDPFRPYVKFGGGYLKKERFRQVNNGNVDPISIQEGIVPSAGLGFAIGVTKELSIKLGLDAWTSPLGKKGQPVVVDYAGRAGISWMF
jgi:outer membrane protein W